MFLFMKNELKPVIRKRKYVIYEYRPTLMHLFYNDMEPITFQRRIRFLGEYLKGYNVFYLEDKGDLVAYSVISHGGGRYHFAERKDIVVGPYFVNPDKRGNHYSEILISELLAYKGLNYRFAYDWIRKTNIPSLKCSTKVGMKIVGEANLKGIFRRIEIVNKDGEFYILRYERV